MASPSSPKGELGDGRLQGLDAWRTWLTLAGIILHAVMLRPSLPIYWIIAVVSEAFRMGTFLFISGLVSGIAMTHRSAAAWLRKRVVQVGIPAAFGWLVLCPLIGQVLTRLPPAAQAVRYCAPFDWHHIWFLVALLLYAPVAYAIVRSPTAARLLSWLGKQVTSPVEIRALYYILLPLCSFLLMACAGMLVLHASPPAWVRTMSQWKLIAGYLPVFLTGLCLARSARLRDAIAARSWPAVTVLAGTAILYAAWYGWLSSTAWGQDVAWTEGLVRGAASAVCPPAVGALVLRTSMALPAPKVSPLFRSISDASMTIYVVHYPILALVNASFAWIDLPEYLKYPAAVLIGITASYAFHYGLVCRSSIASLLFNGRMPRPSRISSMVAVAV